VSGIEIERLHVRRDAVEAIVGLSLDVPAGSWTCLIGPNGAGKSTVLAAVAGLVAYGGAIRVGGTDLAPLRHADRARRVALVPQSPVIPLQMTVADYILLGRTPHVATFGRESAADLDVCASLAQSLHLDHLMARPIHSLSGGERQRAVIARALAQGATTLLLDEPTSALDLGHQQQTLALVAEACRDSTTTVLAAMHDLTLAGQYGDQLALLSNGALVLAGPPRDVLSERLIGEHYGASVSVVEDPDGGLAVIPRRSDLGVRGPVSS
jgi:iron complex transport system ATP-binding protein